MTARKQKKQIREGGGNVFADLGFADAPTALAKAELASRISLCESFETALRSES